MTELGWVYWFNWWTGISYAWIIPAEVLFAVGVHVARHPEYRLRAVALGALAAWFVAQCGHHHLEYAAALFQGHAPHASTMTDGLMALATTLFEIVAGVLIGSYTFRLYRPQEDAS